MAIAAVALAVVAAIALPGLAGERSNGAEDPLRVLFIGHSYFFFNDLPAQLRSLAESAGLPLEVEMVASPNATLTRHLEQGEALEKIARWRPDYVVLNEQSLLGGRREGGRERVAFEVDAFQRAVRIFDDAISAAGARTVLFLSWPRRYAPGDQRLLSLHYLKIGQELDAIVAPVGPAWLRARARAVDVDLYTRDDSHPAPAGTYLAACVLFATLYGQSPIGLVSRIPSSDASREPAEEILIDLPDAEARQLQEIAWSSWTDLRAASLESHELQSRRPNEP